MVYKVEPSASWIRHICVYRHDMWAPVGTRRKERGNDALLEAALGLAYFTCVRNM